MTDLGDKAKERFYRETKPEEVEGVKIDWSPLPHPAIRDLRGMRFGKLIVKAYSYTREQANGIPCVYWKCQCDCGEDTDVSRDHLVRQGTKSCGCLGVCGKKGRDAVQKKMQKRAHYIKRMRHGLPPVPPTEVIGNPAHVFAYDSLMAYACLQWAGYEPAAHHHLIARYLEKVEKGKIRRLIIQMPPRAGKSMVVSEYFPAWFLGRNPDKRVIATSYGQELASDFGRKVRNQIADPMYSEIFPGVALAGDSAASDKFDLAPPHKGGYFAVGAGGAITGRGANCVAEGTRVDTDYSHFNIEEIEDEIAAGNPLKALSMNLKTGRFEFKRITATSKSFHKKYISIFTKGGLKIEVTPEHLIYVGVSEEDGGAYFDYIEAKDCKEEMLVSLFGGIAIIDRVDFCESTQHLRFYDIQVEDNHNFFANGILVHNCLIIDDPIKSREDSDSETSRRKIKDWYTAVAYTRLMDNGAIIICQTRWHTDDLAGWLMKEHKHEKWVVLNLPAINDQGEALWPERFPLDILHQIKKTLPSRDWEALYQQRPFVEEGNIFKRQWWKLWPDTKPIPECEFIIQSWDTAFTDKDLKNNSFSARVTLGVFKRTDDECHNIMLLESWKGRVDYHDLRKNAVKAYQDYEPDKVIIEKKASGQVLIQDLRRAGLPITHYTPTKDKITRAYAAQSLLENGRVYYPSRQWAEDFISALAAFPQGTSDDEVDAFTQAIIWLQSSFLVAHEDDAKRRQQEDDEDELPSNVTWLYGSRKKQKRRAYG